MSKMLAINKCSSLFSRQLMTKSKILSYNNLFCFRYDHEHIEFNLRQITHSTYPISGKILIITSVEYNCIQYNLKLL